MGKYFHCLVCQRRESHIWHWTPVRSDSVPAKTSQMVGNSGKPSGKHTQTHNCECLLCACESALICFRYSAAFVKANAAYVQRAVYKWKHSHRRRDLSFMHKRCQLSKHQLQQKRGFRLPFAQFSSEPGWRYPYPSPPTQDIVLHTWACHNVTSLA